MERSHSGFAGFRRTPSLCERGRDTRSDPRRGQRAGDRNRVRRGLAARARSANRDLASGAPPALRLHRRGSARAARPARTRERSAGSPKRASSARAARSHSSSSPSTTRPFPGTSSSSRRWPARRRARHIRLTPGSPCAMNRCANCLRGSSGSQWMRDSSRQTSRRTMRRFVSRPHGMGCSCNRSTTRWWMCPSCCADTSRG